MAIFSTIYGAPSNQQVQTKNILVKEMFHQTNYNAGREFSHSSNMH